MTDLVEASRRPFRRLLHDCNFSDWGGIGLWLDEGATEAVRWAGGLNFLLEELGISLVFDLQAFAPGSGKDYKLVGAEVVTRGIFLVTTFVWDVEGAVLNAARTYGLTEVAVACSVSEEAHACHPHAAHISEETGGRVSFADVSHQLNVSLVRMLKIDAEGGTSRRRYSSGVAATSDDAGPDCLDRDFHGPDSAASHPPENVLVSVVHSPIHIGCVLQAPASLSGDEATTDPKVAAAGRGHHGVPTAAAGGGHMGQCSVFTLASPTCARLFPLRRCDLEGGGGEGAGAALLSAAAAVEGGERQGAEGRVSAEDVPRNERLRYRLLAHSLAELLWEQALLDVGGGGGVFTLGATSHLIGTTLATTVEDIRRNAASDASFAGSTRGNGNSPGERSGRASISRREASIVLVDRTLDLATAASKGGSLLQRILSSLPRTGNPGGPSHLFPPEETENAANPPASASVGEWSPLATAHQQDIGVFLQSLSPGLGMPSYGGQGGRGVRVAEGGNAPNEVGADGEAGCRSGAAWFHAMKALAGFPWAAPLSLCHPPSPDRSGVPGPAASLVHAIASLDEDEGQAALVAALERCIHEYGCVPPVKRKRGMGASIMALVISLAKGNPRPGGRGGVQVCFRCRGVVQVALTAMEAHQRTSNLSGSRWAETLAAERVQQQELRDGAKAHIVMEQLCATLEAATSSSSHGPEQSKRPAASAASVRNPFESVARDALLLALRGVAFGGGSIGSEEASRFRRAWVAFMMAGGVREAGSAVPRTVAERVERFLSRSSLQDSATAAAAAAQSNEAREGGRPARSEEDGEVGLRLELEDIARERVQRLREAAASRFHLEAPALRDIGSQPYTFVAMPSESTKQGGRGLGGDNEHDEGDGVGDGSDSEGWDDWDDEEIPGRKSDGTGQSELASERAAATAECDTLIGRVTGLLLDRNKPDLPDIVEAKLVSATSVGLGLLSSGLKKFARIGAGGRGQSRNQNRPSDRQVIVIFVVGGFTPLELAEVNAVLRCAALGSGNKAMATREVILAGTTISTPDMVHEQVFVLPPAGQR